MGPLPKRKHTRRRRGNRRSHDALTLPHLAKCENCGAYKPVHRVCPECGEYHGHVVFEIEDAKK